MDERRALVAGILTDADEDTPRLAFADWLDEHGEHERAEFIRLQCVDGRRDEGDPVRVETQERIDWLRETYGARWLGPLAGHVRAEPLRFGRGLASFQFMEAEFVTPEVQAAAIEAFPLLGVDFLALTPTFEPRSLLSGLARVLISRSAGGMIREISATDQIARSPALAWVAKLFLSHSSTSDIALGQFAASPHVGRLNELMLGTPRCTDTGLRALARSTALPNLRRLELMSVGGLASRSFTDAGVRAVLGSERLPKLNGLKVSSWVPMRFDLRALLSDPAAARLRRLAVGFVDALADVARATQLTALEELQIDGPQPVVTDRGVDTFLDNPALRGVRRLTLTGIRRANVRLSAGAEARLRDRFGDRFVCVYHPDP